MKLKDLEKIGAIASNKLHKRTITVKRPITTPAEEWADPEIEEFTGEVEEMTFDVHIRKSTSADVLEALRSDKREQGFVPIFRCVCAPDGAQLFETLEQAMDLQLWMTIPLLEAIAEVAGTSPKPSAPKTSSGVS